MGATSAGQDRPPPPSFEWAQALERARELLAPEEWRSVEKEDHAVKRVKKLVEVASMRLNEARARVNAGMFDPAARALSQYQVIVSAAFSTIDPLTEGDRKRRRSGYKEFDVRTRPHLPILERMAREFTAQNLPDGEAVLVSVRRLRALALNRFSGSEIMAVPEAR